MRIEGRETVPAARDVVWRALQDPAVLRACTPGLVRLDETAPDHYEATLEVKVPAVTGRFDGSADVVERQEPERMRLRVKGKGPPGFVDGSAELRLAEAAEGATEVHYVAEVQVGGQVARLGQRMLSGVTREMAGQFFEQLARVTSAQTAQAGAGAAGAVAAPPAPPNPLLAGLQLFWRTLLNLLGLSKRS